HEEKFRARVPARPSLRGRQEKASAGADDGVVGAAGEALLEPEVDGPDLGDVGGARREEPGARYAAATAARAQAEALGEEILAAAHDVPDVALAADVAAAGEVEDGVEGEEQVGGRAHRDSTAQRARGPVGV